MHPIARFCLVAAVTAVALPACAPPAVLRADPIQVPVSLGPVTRIGGGQQNAGGVLARSTEFEVRAAHVESGSGVYRSSAYFDPGEYRYAMQLQEALVACPTCTVQVRGIATTGYWLWILGSAIVNTAGATTELRSPAPAGGGK